MIMGRRLLLLAVHWIVYRSLLNWIDLLFTWILIYHHGISKSRGRIYFLLSGFRFSDLVQKMEDQLIILQKSTAISCSQ
ncbi:hypothetical protein ES288_A03G010200v1 [Gossypium darwinii]|uniref:Uncharacterized protein n=1 Tax=Gossypium darwinii TaxID=34276 RepID=A0A5D2GYR4_GOSDA|nr:hypothetical protein ES288_A03G010200v1 [Gossypium darwinii]